jgi:hypothetical protein
VFAQGIRVGDGRPLDAERWSARHAGQLKQLNVASATWSSSDLTDQNLNRIDILFGTAAVAPEFACRVTG